MPVRGSSRVARIAILLLPSLIVLACVGITTSIAVRVQERSIRDVTTDRVTDVATSLADLDQVREALEGGAEYAAIDRDQLSESQRDDIIAAASRELQPLSQLVTRSAGVDYVVIADIRGIRATHPDPEKLGKEVSTDHTDVILGNTYVGTEIGTIGPTLRAKVPIRDADDNVIGVVSVGILESSIAQEFDQALGRLLPWAVSALIVGTLASSLIAAAIERRFRRLDEASREAEQLSRTATALQEQSHEFSTRLHVIHGLVAHGDSAEALSYIATIAPVLTGDDDESLQHQPLLRATIDALRAEMSVTGATLETAIEVRSEVDADVTLVLANLCRNAAEAGATRVALSLEERDDRFYGEVADDGPGIDSATAERIFTRGYSSKVDRSGTGRGIGLDLVRRAVTERGGAVEVGRAELGGARFRFTMSTSMAVAP